MLHAQHEVKITALANSGDGIGHIEGRVIFVPYSCPGDTLTVEITKVQKNFLFGKIKKIVEPSLERVEPHCPIFTKCGGCDWQHLPYKSQLQWKEKNLRDVLQRIGKIKDSPILPIQANSKPFNYRNRIQLEYDKKGFYMHQRGSEKFISIESCPLAEEKINKGLFEVHQQLAKENKKGRVEILSVKEGLDVYPANKKSQTDFGFRQVNDEQNQFLQNKLVKLVEQKNIEQVIDLYCGQGNWSLRLAKSFPQLEILGIDSQAVSIERAQRKAKNLSSPPQFLRGKVEALYEAKLKNSSLVIIDPPRAGCSSNLLKKLLKRPSAWLVYISCHPATMARDLASLCASYQLLEVQPVDMFPQTAHLECMTLLRSASQVNTDH